jgi:DNA polymerase III subunit beta
MKFIINREQLLTPLQQIVGVIEKRQTMPILSNILIIIDNNTLKLTGTDLEIQIITEVIINGAEVGTVTVSARKLLDICRLLPYQADINIEQLNPEDKIKVFSGRSRFTLSTLPAENYPKFIETEFEHKFVIRSGQLKKALDKTLFCMANQDVRFYLNGLLLNISNQKLKIVTSDGHRLAIYEDTLEQPTGYEAKIVLPRKCVVELAKLLDDSDSEIKIEFSVNNIRIYIKDLIFSAKLMDAKYPDYMKVFNQSFLNTLLVSKRLLKETLMRVAILSNEKFKGVSFEIANDSIKISAHNPEHEEAEEECLCNYTGTPLSIAFNVQYLLDAISNINSEIAALNIASNASTCVIEESEQQTYKFIVMSMRL